MTRAKDWSISERRTYYLKNRDRILASNEKSRQKNKTKDIEAKRNYHLKRKYKMTPQEYEAMSKSQDGCCLICTNKCDVWSWLSIDHCHSTGKIRGLLCHKCNTGLGKFLDNPILLERAAQYLRNFQ